MKKRILSIVLSLALVCTLLPQAFLPARAVTKQDVCMDDYAEPLGTNYTVHFSVPAGVTKPAPVKFVNRADLERIMQINELNTITDDFPSAVKTPQLSKININAIPVRVGRHTPARYSTKNIP